MHEQSPAVCFGDFDVVVVLVTSGTDEKGKVDRAVFKSACEVLAVAGDDAKCEMRMLFTDCSHCNGETSERGYFSRADDERSRELVRVRRFERRFRPCRELDYTARTPQEEATFLGELEMAGGSFEKLGADFVFVRGELLREGGLRDMESLGGTGEAPFVGNCEKVVENAKFHRRKVYHLHCISVNYRYDKIMILVIGREL